MEPNQKEQITEEPKSTSISGICPVCHQPTTPQYYFCPNCGAKLLNVAPLSTTAWTQVWIYLFSIILPAIGFIFITRWPGMKYYKSTDPKAKQIGQIAWVLIIVSTLVVIWLAVILTQKMIQSSLDSINADFGNF